MKTEKKERPILFSAPMIRALLDGRKTQTRRIVKPQPAPDTEYIGVGGGRDGRTFYSPMRHDRGDDFVTGPDAVFYCPYGKPGDRLWVKETWARHTPLALPSYRPKGMPPGHDLVYRADDAKGIFSGNWTPSIHMPRWASRITLEITNIRIERVEDISDEDAKAEGLRVRHEKNELVDMFEYTGSGIWHVSPRAAFLELFYDINERAPKGSNPWVWALTFKVV